MTKARSSDTFHAGDLLNNTYRIEALLGRGGTSDVYKARSEISGRLVAVKVLQSELSKNENYLRLMTREEQIRDVRHDAVVRYSENQRTQEGQVYLVMDYVEGPGLEEKLLSGGMSAPDLMKVAARVAQGLQAAHERNIVHRDLSPDNIILRNGKPEEAVIIDFGIAKDDNPGAETVVGNEFAGKYAYAAPEQLNGHSDVRTDIYSLGVLLLATFRGKAPNIGDNPMELLRIKERPQDVEGVPEPLGSLITKMTDPDPAKRLQTAEDVLRSIDPTYKSRHVMQTETAKPAAAPAPAPKKRKGGLVAVLLLGLVGLAGGGAYSTGLLSSLFTPALPVANPYILTLEQPGTGAASGVGNAPDEAMKTALTEIIAAKGGQADISLATGAIAESWAGDVLALAKRVAPLPEWNLAVQDNAVTITGLTEDRVEYEALQSELPGLSGALSTTLALTLGPRFLTADRIAGLVQGFADCGALQISDAPVTGWGIGDKIIITGRMADQSTRAQLFAALNRVIGERSVLIDVEVLNQNLCKIEQALPRAANAGFGVIFGFGDRDTPNPAARYFVGENPAIDIVIPADMTTGFLWVAIVDVTGSVFHLLPNVNRPQNDIETLREGRSGEVLVRVAYGVEEAKGSTRMAFMVDDSVLGKSKVVVLHAGQQVFENLRPISESTDSFAAALGSQEGDSDMVEVFSIDSRILTTEQK